MLKYYRVSAELLCLLMYVAIVLPWAFNSGTIASFIAIGIGVFLVIPYILFFYIKSRQNKDTNQYLAEDTPN